MGHQCADVRPGAVRRGAAGRGAGLGRQTEEGGKGGAPCGHRGWHSGSRGGASSALSLSTTTVSPRAFAQAGREALRLLRVDCRGWCAWPRETECPRSQVGWTRTRCPPPGCAAQNQRGTAKSWPDERPCGRAASSPPTTASPATPKERQGGRERVIITLISLTHTHSLTHLSLGVCLSVCASPCRARRRLSVPVCLSVPVSVCVSLCLSVCQSLTLPCASS